MNVNFSTNTYKPNFKAAFSDDITTKANLKELAKLHPQTLLAINLALIDIDSADKLAVRTFDPLRDMLSFENTKTNASMTTSFYDIDEVLFNLCGNKGGIMSKSVPLFNKSTKLAPMDYYKKAISLLASGTNKFIQQKNLLQAEINDKKNEISNLEKKLGVLDKKIKAQKANVVEKLIVFDA